MKTATPSAPSAPAEPLSAAEPQASSIGDMCFGMGAKLLYAATRVALPPLALQHMGLADYGLWSTCFVLVSYIGMCASGFSLIYLRQTALHHQRGDLAAIGRLLSTGMLAMGSLALLLLLGLYLALPHLLDLFKVAAEQRELARDLWLGALAVFLADMSLGAFANVLHAVGRLRQEQRVWVAAFVVEAVLIVLFLRLGWGVRALLAAFAGRYLFSALANAWLACRALPGLRLSPQLFEPALLKQFFAYGAGMQLSGLMATGLQSIDRLLAGSLIGPQAAALFDLASKLPVTASAATASVSGVAVSAAARHDASDSAQARAGLRRVYEDASRLSVASLAWVMPFLALFAQPLVHAWLGQGEASALVAPLMLWLTIGLHAHMLTGPATAVARGRGELGPDFRYHGLRLAALAVAIACCLFFTDQPAPGVQLMPLALALCLAQCAAALVFLAWAHRNLQGRWVDLARQVLLPTLLAYALAYALAYMLEQLLSQGLAAQAQRLQLLLGLVMAFLLWTLAVLMLLSTLLLNATERRAMARRCLPKRLWRPA
ncbi:oligosaccharide flippase family protein [Paucibacter sp. hw8]|uniref:Oligosaccharide flippase family protein n=2 Tax=Roseateles albus TaxID=2987525 RepID=A0ABT5KHG9_9BURK|nr:oligosaccharide flippase family protein [Roseateles albus]